MGPKKYWVNHFGFKHFLVQRNSESKICLAQMNFGSEKMFEKFLGPKQILGWKEKYGSEFFFFKILSGPMKLMVQNCLAGNVLLLNAAHINLKVVDFRKYYY